MYDEKFMRRAIEMSARALDQPGARPYGAVVVKDGTVIGEGLNQSGKTFDPTSHGEVEAVRDACAQAENDRPDGLRTLFVVRALPALRQRDDDRRHHPTLLRSFAGAVRRDHRAWAHTVNRGVAPRERAAAAGPCNAIGSETRRRCGCRAAGVGEEASITIRQPSARAPDRSGTARAAPPHRPSPPRDGAP